MIKLINGEQPVSGELYDLVNDPLEINNVVADAANMEMLEHLRAENAVLVKELRGTGPLDTYFKVNRVGKDGRFNRVRLSMGERL